MLDCINVLPNFRFLIYALQAAIEAALYSHHQRSAVSRLRACVFQIIFLYVFKNSLVDAEETSELAAPPSQARGGKHTIRTR